MSALSSNNSGLWPQALSGVADGSGQLNACLHWYSPTASHHQTPRRKNRLVMRDLMWDRRRRSEAVGAVIKLGRLCPGRQPEGRHSIHNRYFQRWDEN